MLLDHRFVDDDAIVDTTDRSLGATHVDYAGCLCCHGVGGHDALHVHEGRFEAHLGKNKVQKMPDVVPDERVWNDEDYVEEPKLILRQAHLFVYSGLQDSLQIIAALDGRVRACDVQVTVLDRLADLELGRGVKRCNLRPVHELSVLPVHVGGRICDELKLVRRDTQLQLKRIFHDICKASFLGVVVAVDRVGLVVPPKARIALSQLFHGLGIDHMCVLVPQISHNVGH